MADVYVYERQRARAAVEQYVQSTRGAGLVADQFRNIAQDTSVVAPLPILPPFPLLGPAQHRLSYDVAHMTNTLQAYQMALQQRADLFAALPPAAAQPPPAPRQLNLQASLFDALPSSAVAQPPPQQQQRAELFAALPPAAAQPPPTLRQPNQLTSLFDVLPSTSAAQPPPPERRTEADFIRAALFNQLPFPETQPPPPGDASGPQ